MDLCKDKVVHKWSDQLHLNMNEVGWLNSHSNEVDQLYSWKKFRNVGFHFVSEILKKRSHCTVRHASFVVESNKKLMFIVPCVNAHFYFNSSIPHTDFSSGPKDFHFLSSFGGESSKIGWSWTVSIHQTPAHVGKKNHYFFLLLPVVVHSPRNLDNSFVPEPTWHLARETIHLTLWPQRKWMKTLHLCLWVSLFAKSDTWTKKMLANFAMDDVATVPLSIWSSEEWHLDNSIRQFPSELGFSLKQW